jgi:tRNA(fMet)-specific endonuclease VapC
MPTLLLDTNIVSYQFKSDSRADLYDIHLAGNLLAVSYMTVAELYRWAVVRDWGKPRIQRLLDHLKQYIVVAPDDGIAWHFARISSIPGHPITDSDAWIAATALAHNLPLVTHNCRHFEHIPDLRVISEAP